MCTCTSVVFDHVLNVSAAVTGSGDGVCLCPRRVFGEKGAFEGELRRRVFAHDRGASSEKALITVLSGRDQEKAHLDIAETVAGESLEKRQHVCLERWHQSCYRQVSLHTLVASLTCCISVLTRERGQTESQQDEQIG